MNGIPTVILGSAVDIVSHCGVPRFHFVDFPLGNPCGKPYDRDMQRTIVGRAIELFETATESATITIDPHQWGSDSWRQAYMELKPEDLERMKVEGEKRRLERQRLRDIGHVRQG